MRVCAGARPSLSVSSPSLPKLTLHNHPHPQRPRHPGRPHRRLRGPRPRRRFAPARPLGGGGGGRAVGDARAILVSIIRRVVAAAGQQGGHQAPQQEGGRPDDGEGGPRGQRAEQLVGEPALLLGRRVCGGVCPVCETAHVCGQLVCVPRWGGGRRGGNAAGLRLSGRAHAARARASEGSRFWHPARQHARAFCMPAVSYGCCALGASTEGRHSLGMGAGGAVFLDAACGG